MRLVLLLLMILSFLPSVLAGDSRVDAKTRLCTFQKPLEIGASVTGRIGEVIPYSTLTKLLFGVPNASYRGSPGSLFIDHYRNLDLQFAGPAYKHGKYVPESLAAFVTNKRSDLGSAQVESLLAGRSKQAFEDASMIIGIDLFYWDAIWATCGYGMARFSTGMQGEFDRDKRRSDVEYAIERLISASHEKGKVLFLGTVPFEDPTKVSINSQTTGIQGFWYPQDYNCVASINERITSLCQTKSNCYVLDFKKLGEELDSGKTIKIGTDTKSIGLYTARPDGVHLSRLGAEASAERMIELFEQHPPSCASSSSGGDSTYNEFIQSDSAR